MSLSVLAILAVLLFVIAGVMNLMGRSFPAAMTDFALAITAWILLM